MRVLILYTYNKGLLSSFFQELSESLFRDGLDIYNFHLKHKKVFFIQNGVEVYGEKRGGFVHNYYKVYKIIKKIQPDVIVSNFSYINPAILFGKLLGVKSNIAWFHTAYGHTRPSWIKVLNKMVYLNMADLVLTNSKSLESEMHSVYRVPIRKTSRIPFWTNISNYYNQSNNLKVVKNESVINIGCPGRLVADKNHTLVIKALYQLKQKQNNCKNIRMYIAGDGLYKNELKQLVTDFNLEQEVLFLGLLNANEIATFYKKMDVMVLPSLHEAFGLVFIEAIAMGAPVLVSNTFGALDFIDSHKFPLEDFSFDPHSIQDLIDKLEPYMQNEGLPTTYFKKMYEETFNKDIIYSSILNIILKK